MTVVFDSIGGRPRHPEKAHRADTPAQKKPDWIRVKAPVSRGYEATRAIVREHGLHTVCEEAGCPNIGECWEKKHATLMIMGDTCTRACAFCNVKTGLPGAARSRRARRRVAEAVAKLGLAHVVITSVDRDDLDDGGAGHFAAVDPRHPRATPGHDHRGADARLPAQGRRAGDGGRGAARRLQPQPRDRAVALSQDPAGRALLPFAAAAAAGEGDRPGDVHQVGHHGRPRRGAERGAAGDGRPASADVDFLTIGQYLQPTRKHARGEALRAAGRVQGLRDHRLCQGLPDGLGEPADALVATTPARTSRGSKAARACRAGEVDGRCAACW